MTVDVCPMPAAVREMPERWRPSPPPMFREGVTTPADLALALDLWRALDLESRRWYWTAGACGALGLTAKDLAAMKRRTESKKSSHPTRATHDR